jgi:hypothetical protein
MASLDVGLLNTYVDIKGLRIFNPKEFSGGVMADVPEIFVSYDLGSFLRHRVHLRQLNLYVKEIIIEQNKNRQLNLASLNMLAAKPKEAKKADKPPEVKIDNFHLRIDRLVYKDFSSGEKARSLEFNINLDQRFKNVDQPSKVASSIAFKLLSQAGVSGLANFGLQVFDQGIAGVGDMFGSAVSTTKGATQDLQKKVEDTVSGLSGELDKIFGSQENK